MQLVVEVSYFLVEYAKATYVHMGSNKEIEAAKRVFVWINRVGKNLFSIRDCQQTLKQQAMSNHMQAIREGFIGLGEQAFMMEILVDYMCNECKPCATYEVNSVG